jgi:hypothetical protein
LLEGAVNETVTCAFPDTPDTAVGGPGTVALAVGVTGLVATDAGPVPIAFVAVTVKVYGVPLDSPVSTIGDAVPVAVKLPGLEVTVYCVIADPPLDSGAKKDIVACTFPATADGDRGAVGSVADADGVTEFDATEGAPVPTTFVAVTVNV